MTQAKKPKETKAAAKTTLRWVTALKPLQRIGKVLKNKLYPPPPAPPAPKWVPQVEDKVRVRVDTNPEFIDRVGTVAYVYADESGQTILGVCFRGYADLTLDVVHPVITNDL